MSRSRVPVYTVHAEGMVPGGAIFAREAIVRLTAGADSPYRILGWRRGRRALFQGAPGGE